MPWSKRKHAHDSAAGRLWDTAELPIRRARRVTGERLPMAEGGWPGSTAYAASRADGLGSIADAT